MAGPGRLPTRALPESRSGKGLEEMPFTDGKPSGRELARIEGLAYELPDAPRFEEDLHPESDGLRKLRDLAGEEEGRSKNVSGLFGRVEGLIKWAFGSFSSDSQSRQAAGSPEYGVTFFSEEVYGKYYSGDHPLLGAPGGQVFFMPMEQALGLNTLGEVARASGMAPSIQDAYRKTDDVLKNPNVYGIVFPTKAMNVEKPLDEHANGWPHYVPGGNTAARLHKEEAGYLLNGTEEFITPGGRPIPPGAKLFKIEPTGDWTVVKDFGEAEPADVQPLDLPAVYQALKSGGHSSGIAALVTGAALVVGLFGGGR